MEIEKEIDHIIAELYRRSRSYSNGTKYYKAYVCKPDTVPHITFPEVGYILTWTEQWGINIELSLTKATRISLQRLHAGPPLVQESRLKCLLLEVFNCRAIFKKRSREIQCQHYYIN